MHFDSRSASSTVHGVKPLGQWFFSFFLSTLKLLGACSDLEGIGTFPSCRFAIRHLLSDICYLCQMHLTFLLSDRKFFIPLSLQTLDFLTSWVNRSLQIDFHTTCYWDFCYLRHLLSETFAIWDNYTQYALQGSPGNASVLEKLLFWPKNSVSLCSNDDVTHKIELQYWANFDPCRPYSCRPYCVYVACRRRKEFWTFASSVSETISKIKACDGPPQVKGIFQAFCKVQQSTINKICSNANYMQPAAGELI